jgi:ATP-dependent protease HslVU (ClpYQ) peptidase subunit
MSIVVAVQKNRDLVMASDSLQSFGDMAVPDGNCLEKKIRKVGDSLLGSTGWSLYENIFDDVVRRRRNIVLGSKAQIFSFFMKLWKDLHSAYTLVNDQCDDRDSPFGDLDSSFMVMNNHGIFHVASDMGISKFEKYYAIGSGGVFSLGALHALYDSELDAEALARRAVEAAIAFDVHCGGDIDARKMKLGRQSR